MKTKRLLLGIAMSVLSASSNAGIVLSYFNADLVYTDVKFNWATTAENNNALFQVQRSTDGGLFWFTISSLEGSGDSNFTIEYETVDNAPAFGENMYRLRQMDVTGQFWIYDPVIITVSPGPPSDLNLFPNPGTDVISVNLGSPWIGFISVQNSIGQTIIEEMPMDGRSYTVSINHLPKGMYYLVMEAGETKVTKKFFKE